MTYGTLLCRVSRGSAAVSAAVRQPIPIAMSTKCSLFSLTTYIIILYIFIFFIFFSIFFYILDYVPEFSSGKKGCAIPRA